MWMPLADYNSDISLIGSARLGISASNNCVILGQLFNLPIL